MWQPESVVPAAVIVVGESTAEVERFRAAVEAQGLSLVPVGSEPEGAPVVVLIADVTIAQEPVGVPVGREVLPVSLGSAVSGLFPELSHLVPSTVGWDVAVARLADTIRYGGQQLLDWNHLVQSADRWLEDPSSATLGTAQQASALSALGSRIALDQPAQSAVVRQYLAGSATHSKRVRRVTTSVLSGVGLVLLVAIVLATSQAISAKVAGDHSLQQADNAAAVRISAAAVDGIGSDPDLPLLLSQHALDLSSIPEVRNAVGVVASSAVAHDSYSLETLPSGLAVSSDGHSAVPSYESSTISLLSPTGEAEHVVTYQPDGAEWEAARVLLSADNTRLAVETSEGVAIYSASDGSEAPGMLPGTNGLHLKSWVDSDLLVVGDAGAALLDTNTGETEALPGAPDDLVTIAVSGNGDFYAVGTDSDLQVIDAFTGELVNSIELNNLRDFAVSNDGSMVVALEMFGAELVRWNSSGEPETNTVSGGVQAIDVAPLGTDYFAVSWVNGWVSIIADAPSASHTTALDNEIVRFPAHAEGVVYLGATAAGDLVTVGFDRYLRVWKTGELATFWHTTAVGVTTPTGAIVPGLTGSHDIDAFPAAAINNQIRYTTDGRFALALRSAADVLSVDGLDDPKPKGSFIGIFSRAFISDDGKWVVVVGSGDPWTVMVQQLSPSGGGWIDTEPTLTFDAQMPTQSTGTLLGPVLVAVADDGESVAIATSTEVRVFTSATASPTSVLFDTPSTPIAVTLDADGARVLTADGLLHLADGTTTDLSAVLEGARQEVGAIAAGTFTDRGLLVLGDTGVIARIENGAADILLSPGSVTGAGTLRVSADGGTVAAVAPDGVTLVDTARKTVIARWNNIAGIRVDDVAFSPDGTSLAMVSSSSQLALVPLEGVDNPVVLTAPRAATADEVLQYELGRNNG